MKYGINKIFAALILIIICCLSACGDKPPSQYELTEDRGIVYKSVDAVDIMLDILYPTNRIKDKNPTVIVLHGGGWISGSSEDFYRDFEPLCSQLREAGAAVVGVNYRLAIDGCSWRDCLEDCEDALSFILENADMYDVDRDNICIIGYSAGGQLALMTAIDACDQVKYCVSMSGPTTFTSTVESIYFSETLNYYTSQIFTGDYMFEQYKASPVIRLNRRCNTEFLLVNGTDDEVVPLSHAELFCNEAKSLRIDFELIIPEGLTHFYPHYSEFGSLCTEIAELISAQFID
ncbi:MAG: alpha/beta hydrolase fold domain-containing protein [Clostridiales bacterium]|nr:alpha/beta hydrolase fold domain-containing protein [Clostridiales bacterium]